MFSVSASGKKAWIFHQGDVLNWPRTEETYSLMPESPKLMFFFILATVLFILTKKR